MGDEYVDHKKTKPKVGFSADDEADQMPNATLAKASHVYACARAAELDTNEVHTNVSLPLCRMSAY